MYPASRGEDDDTFTQVDDFGRSRSERHARLACGRPRSQYRRPWPGKNRPNDGPSWLHHGRRTAAHECRRHLGDGRLQWRGAFTHTAFNDAEIVAANLLDHDPRRVTDRIPAYALYIDPPLGRCGLTEAEVRQRGRPALVGKRPMTKIKRAIEKGETQGFIKIFVDTGTPRFWAPWSSARAAMRSSIPSST